MNRADIAEHVEGLQDGGADMTMLLFALTLQNANEFGTWDVEHRPSYLRALTGTTGEKAEAQVPAIREAVERLKESGVFASHATIYRPAIVMPRHVLARGAGDDLGDRRAGGTLPTVTVLEGAA